LKGETFLRFIVAVLFSTIVIRCSQAQQPISAGEVERWLDYQQKLNESRQEMDLRSLAGSRSIPSEGTISLARLRHTPPAKALKAFRQGLKLDSAGNALESAEAFRQAVAFDPAYSEAYTDLGVEYINLGLVDAAVAEFRSATALDPATSIHHSNLGLALIILGRFREAETEARTAVDLDGTNMRAHYLLGYLLTQRPETQAAGEEHLKYAARVLPDAHFVLAELYRTTGREDLAEAESMQFLQAVNARAPAHNRR
jgi:Flp pilus assembly protein TadD